AAPSAEPVTVTLSLLAGDYTIRLAGTGRASLWVAGLSSPLGPDAADVRRMPQPLPPDADTLGFWWEPSRSTPSTSPRPPVPDQPIVQPVEREPGGPATSTDPGFALPDPAVSRLAQPRLDSAVAAAHATVPSSSNVTPGL